VPQGAATIGARTEHIELVPDAAGPAEVTLVEHLGSENHLHLEVNGHRLVTLAAPERQWRPGTRARVRLQRPLYFDAGGTALAAG
jgi:multiple sugar transport system ATP-binding protein